MSSEYGHEFWTSESPYHELAEQFEQSIEIVPPRGHFECRANSIGGHCPFCATAVTYYEYRGESI